MAKITEVTYGHTFNLGNYESLRVELKASVDDGEDPYEAIKALAAKAAAYRQEGGH